MVVKNDLTSIKISKEKAKDKSLVNDKKKGLKMKSKFDTVTKKEITSEEV
jgi:hypothetical protein